jgi:opacity protein-like surface antigen
MEIKKIKINLKILSLIAMAIVVSFMESSRAETVDPSERGVSFGPRASFFKGKDADEGEWSGGAQLRVRPFQAIGFEGSIDYRREKFGSTRVHVYPVQASLLAYILPMNPVSIFLLGGAGWYYTKIDRPHPLNDRTDHRFGMHAGGGVEISLSDSWSLDGTYRYIWLEDFKSTDAALLEKDFSDSGSQVTIGANYHF